MVSLGPMMDEGAFQEDLPALAWRPAGHVGQRSRHAAGACLLLGCSESPLREVLRHLGIVGAVIGGRGSYLARRGNRWAQPYLRQRRAARVRQGGFDPRANAIEMHDRAGHEDPRPFRVVLFEHIRHVGDLVAIHDAEAVVVEQGELHSGLLSMRGARDDTCL